MNLRIPFFILFICIGVVTFAQNTIEGIVSDDGNVPLPFANIILYNEGSDKPIEGAVSNENGVYLFESVANGRYLIEVSVLGFETKKSEPFELTNKHTLNFQLIEETQTLDEVVVKGNRPIIRQTAEKLIVDIENSEMVNNNLQDVVKKVPGIIMTNNKISYAGQSNIRILINGKTTDYMDTEALLKDFPADNISKIELIQQPGAEFDAEGSGPLLNIILKKNVKLGTHGNIKAVTGYVEDFMYSTGASVASYKNKLNWQANIGFAKYSWREDLFLSRNVLDETYNQTSISPFDPVISNAGLGFDYYVSSNHSVGLKASRNQSISDRITNNTTEVVNGTDTAKLLTDNSFERDRTVFKINPYYEFNNEKDKFLLDYNFVDYGYNNENNLFKVQESVIPYNNQRYFQSATFKINTFKTDYKRTVNDNFSWTSGLKYSKVNSDSDLESYTQDATQVFVFDSNQSNRFVIDETILAAYSKITGKVDKWTFSGGLRWEESDTQGTAKTTNITRTRKISKLFPSASITREITDEIGVNLAYSYRIQRPAYSSLNSFVYYYDPFTFEEGNPNLKPAFTNSYQFNLTYEQQPFFNIGYTETTDELFELVSQNDATAATSRSVINLASNKNWTFSLFAPLSFIKGLDGYTGVIANHNHYKSANLSPELDLSKWSITWFTSAEYKLPWEINAELSSYYSSGGLEGIIDYDWIAGLDIAFSKKFLNDKLKVTLEYEEIIQRKFYGSINYSNVNANVVSDYARHNVFLQLNYSFGSKLGKSNTRKNASKEEQDRIKVSN